jgi:hypothetical protein
MDVPENIASSTDKFKNIIYSVLFTIVFPWNKAVYVQEIYYS